MSSFLSSIGATSQTRAQFQSSDFHQFQLARVSRVDRGACRILIDDGRELAAEPTGALTYRATTPADLPAVGDWVAAQILGSQAIVHAVLPRATVFARRTPGGREEQQVMAANIDAVFIVCGLDGDANPRRLERYLTLAIESGASPVVILNKADLCSDLNSARLEAERVATGIPVVALQATSAASAAKIRNHIAPSATVALIGSSGTGKSTLTNQLLGTQTQSTGPVREHDARGRHTTTFRQLIPLPGGGALIDTPGLRELQLWASQDSLDTTFGEIAKAAEGCHFKDCSHHTEPGCAVQAALLDGTLDHGRWASYQKLQKEIRHHEVATDQVAARAQKQRWKILHKAIRNHNKRR